MEIKERTDLPAMRLFDKLMKVKIRTYSYQWIELLLILHRFIWFTKSSSGVKPVPYQEEFYELLTGTNILPS